MYLIKNLTKNYEFDNIIEYKINEQPNLIAKKQFVNGKRKKIVTDYIDNTISFNLKGLSGSVAKTYLDNLIDGDIYEYWSIKNNEYRRAHFIITLPELPLKTCLSEDDSLINEFTILLEKSDDYEESI